MNIKAVMTVVTALCLLAGCSAKQDASKASLPAPADVTATPEPAPIATADATPTDPADNFDTGYSVKTLMNAIIQPNATEIWQAVRYVVTEDGVTDDVQPQSDEDWARLRQSAITLVEAGNALLVPGRAMDNMPLEPDYPAFKYRPEEIRSMVEADPEGWRYFVQQMQFSTKTTLEAIEKRDTLGLIDTGGRINNACQGCHAEFWYRPNNQ